MPLQVGYCWKQESGLLKYASRQPGHQRLFEKWFREVLKGAAQILNVLRVHDCRICVACLKLIGIPGSFFVFGSDSAL